MKEQTQGRKRIQKKRKITWIDPRVRTHILPKSSGKSNKKVIFKIWLCFSLLTNFKDTSVTLEVPWQLQIGPKSRIPRTAPSCKHLSITLTFSSGGLIFREWAMGTGIGEDDTWYCGDYLVQLLLHLPLKMTEHRGMGMRVWESEWVSERSQCKGGD